MNHDEMRRRINQVLDLFFRSAEDDLLLDNDDASQFILGSTLACAGDVLAERVLGSPPDIELAHKLAQSTIDDPSVEAPAWHIESVIRSFGGETQAIVGLVPEDIVDASFDAIFLLMNALKLSSSQADLLRNELVDIVVLRQSDSRSG